MRQLFLLGFALFTEILACVHWTCLLWACSSYCSVSNTFLSFSRSIFHPSLRIIESSSESNQSTLITLLAERNKQNFFFKILIDFDIHRFYIISHSTAVQRMSSDKQWNTALTYSYCRPRSLFAYNQQQFQYLINMIKTNFFFDSLKKVLHSDSPSWISSTLPAKW